MESVSWGGLKSNYPKPPLLHGKEPILTIINSIPILDLSKRPLGPNGCGICREFPHGAKIITEFCEIKRNAISGCPGCSMIEKACRNFGVLETVVGWQEESRGQQTQYSLEYTTEDDDTRYVYIDENMLDVHIDCRPALKDHGCDSQVLVTLYGVHNLPSQPIELYRTNALDRENLSPTISRSRAKSLYAWTNKLRPGTVDDKGECRLWQAIGTSEDIPPFSGDRVCLDIAKDWLERCLRDHSACRTASAQSSDRIRFLEVSGGRVRLVDHETAGTPKYGALSYCWGPPGKGRYTTTSKNFQAHQQGIAWENLSKTHQDAITVARHLDLSHIWIDALCIVQDSPSDWAEQASYMADIFENSVVTLCATWSADTNLGMFSDRHQTRRETSQAGHPAHAKPLRVSSNDEPPVHARLVFKQHFFNREMQEFHETGQRHSTETDPLLTRAWCFQERLLSPRILDFTCDELQWECRSSRQCECKDANRRDRSTQKALLSRWIQNLEPQGMTEMQLWHNIVSTFTGLDITYPLDRLPALSGLAHKVQTRTGVTHLQEGTYLAGIWRRHLPASLNWQMQAPWCTETYRTNEWQEKLRGTVIHGYRAPSWSWAAHEGKVEFKALDADPRLKIQEVVYHAVVPVDPCGQCASASLTIFGLVASATLRYRSTSSYDVVQDGLSTPLLEDTRIGLPGSQDFVPDGGTVYCLKLGWNERAYKWSPLEVCGLVLRYDDSQHAYVRIGRFARVERPSGLKLRLRLKKDGSGKEDLAHKSEALRILQQEIERQILQQELERQKQESERQRQEMKEENDGLKKQIQELMDLLKQSMPAQTSQRGSRK